MNMTFFSLPLSYVPFSSFLVFSHHIREVGNQTRSRKQQAECFASPIAPPATHAVASETEASFLLYISTTLYESNIPIHINQSHTTTFANVTLNN